MGLLGKIFTWWNGATIGTALYSWRKGERVGEDALGNVYFRARDGSRRWVIYSGSNDASRVAPEWHGWLHGTTDALPDDAPPPREWHKPALPNSTGSAAAYRPAGALDRGGARARSSGDYSAWQPDGA
jgi:NADH:ubiquinone oxidoreductase subunit